MLTIDRENGPGAIGRCRLLLHPDDSASQERERLEEAASQGLRRNPTR